MITSFAIECIKGTLKKVQTITYTNGQRVKRIFAPSGVIPEEVHILADHQGISVPPQIEHRECELYRHYFGV
jgi:hypothetical protein